MSRQIGYLYLVENRNDSQFKSLVFPKTTLRVEMGLDHCWIFTRRPLELLAPNARASQCELYVPDYLNIRGNLIKVEKKSHLGYHAIVTLKENVSEFVVGTFCD